MPSAPAAPQKIRSPALHAFVGHWFASRRAGERVTRRGDFDIFHLPALVPHLFLYDYDPATRGFTLRVAGEEIRRLLPNSLPGTPLEQIMPAAVLPVVLERYRRVCEEPAILHGAGRVFVNLGGSGVGERVVLPLAGEDGQVRQMIGATIYSFGDRLPDGSSFAREEVTTTFTPL
ncbi:PAS domain-containing protein [Ferrovibrio sp.]|uniref:PAS domain-containing protein n=1 Tax=Ferrovibrio sp. TaxID=1917215 RepID=UPI00263537D0|nr:PAS domain-containing protein [Ferrovibrio sp.]